MPAKEPQPTVRVPHQPVSLRTVPRDQHGISRKNISPNALRVLYRLRDAGFQAYLVGGAVRDLLLGGHPKDFDVATDATPEQVKQQFRNCRLIGRRFRLAHVVFGPETIEVATFRAHVDDGSGDRHVVDGRIVRDNVYGSIEEDAVRRDFTVNALYYAVEDFSVRDYVGGFADIEQRCLRLIGDAEQRYREDPVRMLRAVRLAAKLGFRIEDSAWAAIATLAPLIADAAPARLFDELLKLFMSGHAHESFRWLEASGLLHFLLPSTAAVMEGRDGTMPALIENALLSTDERMLGGKSVTPAFLLAALLWPAVRAREAQLRTQGSDPQLALTKAANQVVQEQVRLISIPKRFSIPMLEIWALQHRFTQLTRKKVVRLMAHPRFRAAFDFLLLRGEEEPALAETIAWWQDAVAKEPHEAAGALVPPVSATPAVRKRRRRKKRDGGPLPPAES